MLTIEEIRKHIAAGDIDVVGLEDYCYSSVSVDLRLNAFCKRVGFETYDVREENKNSSFVIDGKPLVLEKGESAAFCTLEQLKLNKNFACLLTCRSSLAKAGIVVHVPALVDPGFNGVVTGLIHNTNTFPVRIPMKFRIMQALFFQVNSAPDYSKLPMSKNSGINAATWHVLRPDKEWRT